MKSTQAIALDRAIALLNAANTEYVVRLPDGTLLQRGDLRIAESESNTDKPKKGSKYGWGTLTNYITPVISTMEVGDVKVIPFSEFDPTDLVKAVSSAACRKWGKGNHISGRTAAGVEVLRVS